MLGVNSWPHGRVTLKEVMAKERIPWRTFDDDGSIHRQWNSPATPTYVLIDANGIIRHTWAGKTSDQSIDTAVERLIPESNHK